MKGPGSSSLHDARVSAALHRVCRAHTRPHTHPEIYTAVASQQTRVCAQNIDPSFLFPVEQFQPPLPSLQDYFK